MSSREAFEAWVDSNFPFKKDRFYLFRGEYKSQFTKQLWQSWQASREGLDAKLKSAENNDVDARCHVAELEAKCAALAAENAGLKECIVNHAPAVEHWNAWADAEDKIPAVPETPATDAFLAEVRASAIPEGYVLVPQEMHLSSEAMEGICFHCGDGGHQFGEFTDGTLFVGEVDYGDGKKVHGLHIATADYPEEGCATICEFAAQPRKGAAQ